MKSLVAFWLRGAVLSLSAVLTFVSNAGAEPSAADRAAAEALFQQAQSLMDQAKAAEACPKFEESQRLDPGVGTLLYLADCYETVGRSASAWGTFLEASYAAKDAGQLDRQAIAEENAARLQPLLSTLVLTVQGKETPGLVISSDNQSLNAAIWGTPIPVDPGPHVVQASAPGRESWAATVTIPSGPSSTQVEVPVLKQLPGPSAAAPPLVAAPPREPDAPLPQAVPAPDTAGSPLRTWGWVALIGGGAALAGSGLFTVLAVVDDGRADDQCRRDDPGLCGPRGVELADSAGQKANVATILAGVGGALAITGGVLILTAPDDPETAALGAGVASGGPMVWMEGRW